MKANPSAHPVRRVREALADLPEESKLPSAATIRGFARFIGCSESAIRSIERGDVPLSDKMAFAIQMRTGVSAKWLQSHPEPSEPIVGRDGRPWTAENLDILAYLPGLKPLMVGCPSMLPSAVGKLIETMLAENLRAGEVNSLVEVLRLLQRRGFFEDPRMAGTIGEATGIRRRVTAASPWDDEEVPPVLLDSIEILADRSPKRSKEQIHKLAFLNSVEPDPSLGPALMENYRRVRTDHMRARVALRRRADLPDLD